MREILRSPAQAVLACLAAAVAEIAWTYGTGFATASESVWIVASWALIAATVAVGVRAIPFRPQSPARVRAYLLVPVAILALRGQYEASALTGTPLTLVVCAGLACLAVLATRRPAALGRIWFIALFLGGASTARLALRSIEGFTMQAVLGVHPDRIAMTTVFGLAVYGLALLAWAWRWDGRSFGIFCLGPSLLATGVFVERVSVRPPLPPVVVESVANRPSVVLIVLDSWRRDGLSALGETLGLTPNLDRFAQGSTLYTNAYSNGTYSLPGHASLFSGLLPSAHGAHPVSRPIQSSVRLIAQDLGAVGYVPYGYSANPVYLAPWTGLQRGFAHFYSDGRDRFGYYPTAAPLFRYLGVRPAEEFWWPATQFLAAVEPIVSTEGTAIFLNLMECHGPWTDFTDLDDRTAYQRTVNRLDATLEPFLRLLATLPNAIVIITSDHGEFLGEHDHHGHGLELYEEGIRIPLIIRVPGQHQGRVDSRRITLMDVTGMLRAAIEGTPNAFGLPLPEEPRVIAESWSPRPGGSARPADGSPASRAIYLGHHKLIEHYDGFLQLFDLSTDPHEKESLTTKDPALARALIPMMLRSVPPMHKSATRPPSAEIPPDVLDRMRALGYIK